MRVCVCVCACVCVCVRVCVRTFDSAGDAQRWVLSELEIDQLCVPNKCIDDRRKRSGDA